MISPPRLWVANKGTEKISNNNPAKTRNGEMSFFIGSCIGCHTKLEKTACGYLGISDEGKCQQHQPEEHHGDHQCGDGEALAFVEMRSPVNLQKRGNSEDDG